MNHEEVRRLEEAIERAVVRALRRNYDRKVPPRIRQFMAKAAVTVLEATVRDETPPGKRPSRPEWIIDDAVVAKVKEFFRLHEGNEFVKQRIARNVNQRPSSPNSLEQFWDCMAICLLTTQQKSGPKSSVNKLSRTTPFPLSYGICCDQPDLADYVRSTITDFGGIRRAKTIGREMADNLEYLSGDGWQKTSAILEEVRGNPTQEVERKAAHFIDENLRGFGPKQSRNLLQGLGLSQHEIPIDSRIAKWLVEFGFPVRENANALANHSYFEYVLDQFQRLSAACGLLPCVLDAAIFSSFDEGGWDDGVDYWLR